MTPDQITTASHLLEQRSFIKCALATLLTADGHFRVRVDSVLLINMPGLPPELTGMVLGQRSGGGSDMVSDMRRGIRDALVTVLERRLTDVDIALVKMGVRFE